MQRPGNGERCSRYGYYVRKLDNLKSPHSPKIPSRRRGRWSQTMVKLEPTLDYSFFGTLLATLVGPEPGVWAGSSVFISIYWTIREMRRFAGSMASLELRSR
jgi:hypothetical protein